MANGKDRGHFEDYREQTQVKHSILAAYLPAYYHILKRSSNNLIYIDGFAGPGSYVQTRTGKTFDGSPILALQLIAENADFSRQVSTVFIESDDVLFNELKRKVDDFYDKHPQIRVEHEDQRRTSHYLIHASKHPLGFRIMKDVMWRRGHGEDQPGGLELRQKSRTNFFPMFDKHADIKGEILGALKAKPLRASVFYEDWTKKPTNMQCEAAYRQTLLELESEGKIEVLGKDGKNVVGVDKRPKPKGKATLAKDYYVRLKN